MDMVQYLGVGKIAVKGAFCKTAESWVIIEDKGVELTGQAVFA